MAFKERYSAAEVKQALAEASTYQPFQLLRYLEKQLGEDVFKQRQVLLKPTHSLAFPAANVVSSEYDETISIVFSFMGLYGVDAALPRYFLEQLQQQASSAERTQAFFDIINHRLYWLLYQAWKRRNFDIALELGDKKYLSVEASLTGHQLLEGQSLSMSPHWVSNQPSLAGLMQLLKTMFDGQSIDIHPNILHAKKIQTLAIFGQTNWCLGENTLLGDTIYDCSEMLEVTVGPISLVQYKAYQAYLPHWLILIKRYIGLFYILKIQCKVILPGESLLLGREDIHLGVNTVLGQGLIEKKLPLMCVDTTT